MTKLIYTSYSPNARAKDLLQNVYLLLKPWGVTKGTFAKKIEEIFENNFNGSNAFTFNYARSGMYVLAKSLNLQKGDEVIMQGFTCVAAVNPFIWTEAKVVYADINPVTCNIEPASIKAKINSHTKAIVFQHTFGNSTGLNDIKNLCKAKNIFLIEDCTNTIFGKHENNLIGSTGDIAIFSFGRDKAISGIDGGLVLINNTALVDSFKNIYKTLKYPNILWTTKELIHPLIWALIKFTWNIKIGKALHLVATKLKLISLATTQEEKNGQMPKNIPCLLPNALAKLAYTQLKDINAINDHRIMLNDIYQQKLNTIKQISILQAPKENILLRFSILVQNRSELIKALQKKNIFVGDWYNTPVAPKGVNNLAVGYIAGMCPNSEQVCEKIINLPNHVNTSNADAEFIIKEITDFYGN
jgi:perosamine synthetase